MPMARMKESALSSFILVPSPINKSASTSWMPIMTREKKKTASFTPISRDRLLIALTYIGVIKRLLSSSAGLALNSRGDHDGFTNAKFSAINTNGKWALPLMGRFRFQVSSLFIEEALVLGLISGVASVVLSSCLLPLVNSIFNGAALGTDLSHFASPFPFPFRPCSSFS